MARLLPAALLVLLAACGPADPPSSEAPAENALPPQETAFTTVETPAPDGAQFPHLTTDGAGGLLLSWTETGDEGPHGGRAGRLAFARFDGNAWGPVRTIAEGPDWFVNWADAPALAARGDTLAAHVLVKNDSGTYAYDVAATRSFDGGATWSPLQALHADGTPTEHGFASLVLQPDGSLFALWLDGRATGGGHGEVPEDGPHSGAAGAMTLRWSLQGPGGTVRAGGESAPALDRRVCDCCNTATVATPSGIVVAYRDRSPDEVRDVATARFDGTSWSTPTIFHPDGWTIDGCPVNGPALAASGETVVMSWFTGARDTSRVRVSVSVDGGREFEAPAVLSEGSALGRVAAVGHGGGALVSWTEHAEDGTAVRLVHVTPEGVSESVRVGEIMPSRASGFPRLAILEGHVYAAWTEPGEDHTPTQLRLVRAPLEAVPRAPDVSLAAH